MSRLTPIARRSLCALLALNAAATALPRFSAVSETFELVGVLDGDRVSFYLDRFADNSPVDQAVLEVEFDGRRLALDDRGHGVFEAELGAAPAAGVIAVTATVLAGDDTDLLAGELDLHDPAPAAVTVGAYDWQAAAGGFGAGVAAAGVFGFVLRRVSARKAVTA